MKYTLSQAGVNISFVVAILVALKLWKQKLTLKFEMPSEKILGLVLIIGICLYVVSDSFNLIYFFKLILDGNLNFIEFKLTERSFLYLLKSIVLAPIFEEILFRRLIFKKLKESFPLWLSIGVSSVLFSLGHMHFSNFVYYFIIGIIICYVYYITQSLFISILLHALFNLGNAILTNVEIDISDSRYIMVLLIYIGSFIGLYLGLKQLKIMYAAQKL